MFLLALVATLAIFLLVVLEQSGEDVRRAADRRQVAVDRSELAVLAVFAVLVMSVGQMAQSQKGTVVRRNASAV